IPEGECDILNDETRRCRYDQRSRKEGDTMSIIVSVSDAKNRLGELLDRAASGEIVIIDRRGKTPVALVPKRKRKTNGKKFPSSVETSSQRAARLAKKLGNRYRLSPRQQRRLQALAKKNKEGRLTPEENKEMLDLLAEYDRMTLLRAKAMGAME